MEFQVNWQEVLAILVPLLGLMGWVYSRIETKADARQAEIKQEFKEIYARFNKVDERFNKVEEKLQILDSRISRIEGQLAPRIWEPQIVEQKEK